MQSATIDSPSVDFKPHPGLDLSKLSREDRLLITCGRQVLAETHRNELRVILSGPVDWAKVVRRAREHKLNGLLYHHLRDPAHAPEVPHHVLERLKREYTHTVARYLLYRTELSRIVKTLEQRGIETIILKGTALVGTVYPDSGLRPMSDIDLLVPAPRAQEAQAAICSLGLRPAGTPEDQEDTERNHRHLPILLGMDRPVAVEVHRHIVRLDSPLVFDIAGFWERAQPVHVAGELAQMLGPEDLLLHLCINFFLDRRYYASSALGQLCDIAEVTRHYQDTFDWEGFTARAREYGLAGPIACSLRISRDLLESEVPDSALQRLWPSGLPDRMLTSFVVRRVMDGEPWVARELVPPHHRYHLLNLLRGVMGRIVPSRKYMISRYGKGAGRLSPGMYATRLGEGLSMLWHFARRPLSLSEDLSLDRWLHDLYNGEQQEKRPERANPSSISE